MKAKVIKMGVLASAILLVAVADLAAAPTMQTLSNGVRVVVVNFPKSTNVSIFTFVPMGLCGDPAGRAQWSHLVEHLVIHSGGGGDLARANAETLADHMRLDFYGHAADWKEGLSQHRRWLEGVPFTAATLAAEKRKVISECDFTSRNFATHKFALAAWSHASRHSNTHVAMKGDVLRATLEEAQAYRHSHFFVSPQTTLCAVGGVDASSFLAEAAKQFGQLTSPARPSPAGRARAARLEITWDLPSRHLLLVWPVPDFAEADFAALMPAAQWLTMQYFTDKELKKLTGQALAGADLVTPEGNYFYVSASLRPDAAFDDVEQMLRAPLKRLSENEIDSPQFRMLAGKLASALTDVPDPAPMVRQLPPGMNPAMIEGNVGLAFAMNVHRYGAHRESLARTLSGISPAAIHTAVAKHLTAVKESVCAISPAGR